MKRIYFIISVLLVSFSILANQVSVSAVKDVAMKQYEPKMEKSLISIKNQMQTQMQEQLVFDQSMSHFDIKKKYPVLNTQIEAKTAADNQNGIDWTKLPVKKVAKFAEGNDNTTITAEEAGVGIAHFNIEFGKKSANKYYQVLLLDENKNILAATAGFYSLAVIEENIGLFETSSEFIYFVYLLSLQGSGYLYTNTNILQPGTYYYGLQGFPLTADGKVDINSSDNDIAITEFTLTLTGEEYAVKNPKATTMENNRISVSWENASETLLEGAFYQVQVINLGLDSIVALSEYGLTGTTWTTPDTIALDDNSSYRIIIGVYSSYGFSIGNRAGVFHSLGVDPKAPKELKVDADDQTMKATFRWERSDKLPSDIDALYSEIYVRDEEGKEFTLDNGGVNTTLDSAVTESLHVGKYTWQMVQFHVVDGNVKILSVIEGPDFDMADGAAPTIQSVSLTYLTETQANLEFSITDNNHYLTLSDILFSVSGDYTLQNQHLGDDYTLALKGLEEKTYNIKITATDPSGNTSEEFEYEFTAQKDTEAPVKLTAEIKQEDIYDIYAIITVSAEDNITTAEQLIYVATYTEDGETVSQQLRATDGRITLKGLKRNTEYDVTIKVKDLAWNESSNSVGLKFTTKEYIELVYDELIAFYLADDNAYIIQMTSSSESDSTVLIIPIILQKSENPAGIYSYGNNLSLIQYVTDAGREYIYAPQVLVKYIQQYNPNEPVYEYHIEFPIGLGLVGGSLYKCSITEAILFIDYDKMEYVEVADTFVDTDAPEIWLYDEANPAEMVNGKVKIMFGAKDGPFWFETKDPVQTDHTKLDLAIIDQNYNIYARMSAGSIVNTPTPDSEGAYYFTATLSKGMKPNTTFNLYIYAADKAENVALLPITFVTDDTITDLLNLNIEKKGNKYILDGRVVIENNGLLYTPNGQQIGK